MQMGIVANLHLDGNTIACYELCIVDHDFPLVEGLEYSKTFSFVLHMESFQLLWI